MWLATHITFGFIALASGLGAITSKKGKKVHRLTGQVYFFAMTVVFITGIYIAYKRDNSFLFLIAFLSYYSVFCGVRSLKLKKLHSTQSPKWYDWAAGLVNGVANLVFVFIGLEMLMRSKPNLSGGLLSIGFAIGGLIISYTNLKPFVTRPKEPYHWYMSHIGNMVGGYIATVTAFFSTTVTRFEFMNPIIAFALPSLLGVPLLLYWQRKITENILTPTR